MTTRKKILPRASVRLLEPLEQRTHFAAVSYTAINLSELITLRPQQSVYGVQITNGGLIAFNVHFREETAGSQLGYIYSLRGHHLYKAPLGETVAAINNRGDAVFHGYSGDIADIDGQLTTLTIPFSYSTFVPTSINNAGQIAGELQRDDPDGDFYYESEVFSADGTVQFTQPNIPFYDSGVAPIINDTGLFSTYPNSSKFTYDRAGLYNLDTQVTIDIGGLFAEGTKVVANDLNQDGQLVGFYVVAGKSDGSFLFDSTSGKLTLIPGSESVFPLAQAVSDTGIIVGENIRGYIYSAAIMNASGGSEDLAQLVDLPHGATLTDAASVNSSGDIVADGTAANGASEVYLLEPKD
jgi:hypothetical protein